LSYFLVCFPISCALLSFPTRRSSDLLAPLRRILRRRGAGGEPALLDGGGGDEPRPQPPRLLRRPHRRPGVPQRHGRLAAADGRAAGRHRNLACGAGQGAGEAGNRESGFGNRKIKGKGGAAGRSAGQRGLGTRRKRRGCRSRQCAFPIPGFRFPIPGLRRRPAVTRATQLSELLPDVAAVPPALEIGGLVLDSRSITPGDAFVAIGGFGTHGLHLVEQARAAGASAIPFEPPVPDDVPAPPADAIAVPGLRARMGAMADQFHGHPSRAMAMVGVTGTSGKTSTLQLLAQAWTLLGTRSGTVGTLGAGLYGETVATGFTTPLVLQMHALLAQLREAGAESVAMEVSSHALDQGRVDAVHFDVGVFTNLSRDHLDYHGDMETY